MVSLIGPALKFLGSTRGGYAIAGIIAAALGLALYIQSLRLDAAHSRADQIQARYDDAAGKNARFEAELKTVTEERDAARERGTKAIADLAAARTRTELQTQSILKEISRVATATDKGPLTPGWRAALDGLREAYPAR